MKRSMSLFRERRHAAQSELLLRACRLRPQNVGFRYFHADALWRVGRLAESARALAECRSVLPDGSGYAENVETSLGQCFRESGQYEKAEERFRAATSLTIEPYAFVLLASILMCRESIEEALAALRLGLEKRGDHLDVYLSIGRCHRAKRD
jgi:tetratricopeptide (TPR) repeat protein